MNIEYVKLAASFLTPVVILLLGIWAKGIATDHEKRISLNERIIEKRVNIYEEIGKELNDIYVFLNQVGHWKEFTPEDIVNKKRNIDKIMYINRPYWSDSTFKKYNAFMAAGFETWTGIGEDAKIKTHIYQFKELSQWNEDWSDYFSKENPSIPDIKATYSDLMSAFSEQFGFVQ